MRGNNFVLLKCDRFFNEPYIIVKHFSSLDPYSELFQNLGSDFHPYYPFCMECIKTVFSVFQIFKFWLLGEDREMDPDTVDPSLYGIRF